MIAQIEDEITLHIHINNKDHVFTQSFDHEEADSVQAILDWYHKPGKYKTFTIARPDATHTFAHIHITAIDVYGYRELNESKWYQRMCDKWITHQQMKRIVSKEKKK